MTIEQTIVSAIRSKKPLEVIHQNHRKLVCPFRIGWKETEDKGIYKNVLVYQFGGYSSKGLEPDGSMDNFRCWNLDDIRSATPIDTEWHHPRGWSTMRSTCVDQVIAEVPRFD